MSSVARLARWYSIIVLVLWIGPKACFSTIGPDEIGVRQSNVSGVHPEDLGPGWAMRVAGLHSMIRLPRRYEFLDYTKDNIGPQDSLQIRTQDNNIVVIDVSVPYHITPGEGHAVVQKGNHREDRNELLRVQRVAEDTTVSVLREKLAQLTSADWYNTERRREVAETTLADLNVSLAEINITAMAVLIRSVTFRPEYEQQLQQIQLNEQVKLLDLARAPVAKRQQALDDFQQGTRAQAAALAQDWATRLARLEGAYQVGFIDTGEDTEPGAARTAMAALEPAARTTLSEQAAEALGITADNVDDAYLLGIKSIQAETLEYDQRIRLAADGVAERLKAEGKTELAQVQGDYETQINELLNSAAGRAWVAYESAANVTFDEKLNFSSSDGIPSVLRLRRFTELFMGE
ncbi:MAG: SPFH domain-containing protein [Myxococcota bacterium]